MLKPFEPLLSQNELADTGADEIALGPYPHVLIIGEGAQTVYVKFGAKGVVATSEDIPILSGMALLFTKPEGAEFLSILAATGTSRLGIIQGRAGV